MENPHLISVDELRAAGALDVPAGWRKSLRVERDLFSGLFADEEARSEEPELPQVDEDADGSADEVG